MPRYLEDAVPPLTAGWLCTCWETAEWTEPEIQRVIGWLEHRIVSSGTKSIHYLFDIAKIAAAARLRGAGEPTLFQMPLPTDLSPIDPPLPSTINAIARLVTGAGQNRHALSLYVFYAALAENRGRTWRPTAADQPPPHFEQAVRAYGEDCKFKRHGDLYLWSLIRLKTPAWLAASYPGHVAPWAAFAIAFTDKANEIGREMVGTPAVALLDASMVAVEQYVIIVGLLLELTSAPGTILVNTLLPTADPLVPTPYASSDFATLEAVYGYTLGTDVLLFDDPWTAAAAWLAALDRAVDNLTDVRLLVEFAAARIPPPDNPFCKFI